jgi:phosphatidylinositol-3-phosphatase
VLVFVMENHSAREMSAQMPYAAALGRRYAMATSYTAATHPSLPNYLVMAGGSTFGVRDDAAPSRHPLRGASVFGLALAHGRTAGLFAEGMTSDCQQTAQGRYAVKHNPWAYFVDERSACRQFDRPLTALGPAVDGGTLPNVGMVVPDLCHDAHDCTLAEADRWLAAWVQRVQGGRDWRSGRLLLVVTADEDDHRAGNRVLTVFAHPELRQLQLARPLGHEALARLLAQAAGAPPPRRAADAPSIAAALDVPVG